MSGLSDAIIRFGLHRAGRDWRGKCPLCGYRDSFVLSLKGGRPVGWCASCQDCAGVGALLRNISGWMPPPPRPDQAEDKRRQTAQAGALALWNGSSPATNSLADAYLRGRALPGLAAAPTLRFRGDAKHPQGGRYPALVAAVVDATGILVAVHRTYLAPPGRKAAVEPTKACLGPVWGGAIRLDEEAPEIVIGEGIESSASAGRLLSLPAWSAISSGNLATGVVLPAAVRSVVIAADADPSGRRAAQEAADRWRHEGRVVRIAEPRHTGQDFNDILRHRLEALDAA